MEVRGKCQRQANEQPQQQQQTQKQQQNQPQQLFEVLQPTQRKCHQNQNERTNHLRLEQIQQKHHINEKHTVLTPQQLKTVQKPNENVEWQQQQSASQRVPKLLHINHHRWPMPTLRTRRATSLPTPSPRSSSTSSKPNVVNEFVRFTAAVISQSLASASIAVGVVTKAKAITAIAGCCRKRFSILWLLTILSVAQFTPTATTSAAASRAAAPMGVFSPTLKLLPHAMLSTVATVTAATLLSQASAAHAAISTANAPTFEPRLTRYKYPTDAEELVGTDGYAGADADADADALVQVQVKRINLLENDDESAAMAATPPPQPEKLEQEELTSEQEEQYDEDQQLSQQAAGRKLNSNEQQLLMFYRRVQHAAEQQEHQRAAQQQQHHGHQYLASHRHYQHSGVKEQPTSFLVESKLHYADAMPTASNVAALPSDDVLAMQSLHKHVTKRSATTKLAPTTVRPIADTTGAVTANISNVVTNVTAAANNTEEKCEPKVLDEVPPEPVSEGTFSPTFYKSLITIK